MNTQNELQTNNLDDVWGFLGGLLVGGLAGATAMLFLAPQSGEMTRSKIMRKSYKLRRQATGAVKDAWKQTDHKAHQIKASVQDQAENVQQRMQDKAEAMQKRGQDVVDEQKERLSNFVEAGNKAVQGALK